MSQAKRRPLPSRTELAIWRDHLEAFDVVRSRIEARLHRDCALSSGDYRVLLALSEEPTHTMRSSELAAHISWERSRLSGQLGRMERRGLIRREPCPEDARGSRVVLTEHGSSAFHGATRPHLEAVKDLFIDAFSPEQLASLGEAAEAMRTHLNRDSAH